MSQIPDHPLRFALANELHARPFPVLQAPARALFIAVKQPRDEAAQAREAALEHLAKLLDRHGAPHPQPGATHYSGRLGRHELKWEQHSEFMTYTVFTEGPQGRAFDPAAADALPADWLAELPGRRLTSALIEVREHPGDAGQICDDLAAWFVPESLAVSRVLDGDAVVAADFHIDDAGHQRMAVFAPAATGARRIGRIVQRLCEIETYKAMSMLAFAAAREIEPQLTRIDRDLSQLIGQMGEEGSEAEETLRALLSIAARLEAMSAETAFRFGAAKAYEAIVAQRIEVLREARFEGRQTFGEFMMRRYDPAMRTVKAAERRLATMAERAIRAGELLRTRVDVERSATTQALLRSMDRRADLQLRLQRTVEGLSVVAISYYAVSLLAYLAYPAAEAAEVSRGWLVAGLVPPVVLAVWLALRRVKAQVH